MESNTISYNSLLVITLLATFTPFVIKKIKWLHIPIVVGEVIAGMIVGKSGLNIIQETPWLGFLYTFGFAFLMFLSGLEVDFDLIRSVRGKTAETWYKKPVFLAFVIFLGTLSMGITISYILKNMNLIINVPLVTLILSTTSLGIVVPTLKERNLLTTSYGQVILLASLVADFATMILVTMYVSFYTTAAVESVLLVLLLFVFFFIIYKAGIRIIGESIIQELAHATSQIKVRGAFALILIFIALAQMLGSEIILGTFLAGLIVSLIDEKDRSQLYLKLDAIGYGFFVPIFFIMVGANFDISYVINHPKSLYLLPALLVSVYLVKIVPALALRTRFSLRETVAAGFLLSSRLSLIIATSAIGLKLNIINQETNGVIVLVAILTCTFSPMLFNRIVPSPNMIQKKDVYIIGVKQVTLLLAKKLKNAGIDVIFITHNPDKYEKSLKQNHSVYLGDPLDPAFLDGTGIKNARTVVISKSSEEISRELIRICSEIFGIDNILLLNGGQTGKHSGNLYGATLISPEFASVFMAENLILHPKAVSLLFGEERNDCTMAETYLNNPSYFDQPIRNLDLPGDCLILSIIRNEEKIIPHGDNILRQGDLLMLVGTGEYVRQAETLLGTKPGSHE